MITLSANFKGEALTRGDPGWEDALKRWTASARREAKIVAYVKDADDIIIALKYAKENGLPLAIASGKHSYAGASSSEGGIVIDLSKHLTGCRIDAENKLAYVLGGTVWGVVEEAAIKHGLATVSGNVHDVSFFYGLISD